ncbi:FadR/GntR family transcriptional regulator [Pseudonocardia sp. CA-107938]|uniref:FadR/GntR family transcriptional regulator n=1 Tax=Pseudonocardia sp. CA-107938 TaxID=3240021 RepID=UPI003D9129BF
MATTRPTVEIMKLPLIVARDLEERFLRDGWPIGRNYGGEAELAAHYGAGRDVMREALRILEARDEIQVRRGPRGGVVVAEPDGAHLQLMLGGYAHLTGLGPAEIVEAWGTLHVTAVRVIGCRGSGTGRSDGMGTSDAAALLRRFGAGLLERSGGLLTYLSEVMEPVLPSLDVTLSAASVDEAWRQILDDLGQGRTEDAVRRTRALFGAVVAPARSRPALPGLGDRIRIPAFGIVRRLMSEIEPDEWVQGRLLGNEYELAERYSADRSVIRQGIRIMEDAETAVMRPGRGRGLTTRRPSSAPLSRQLCVHLAAKGAPGDEASVVVRELLIEIAELARTRSAHNALLQLFADGVEAHLAWSVGEERAAP